MQELFFFAVLAGSFLRMDALMWRCAGWAGRGIIHHPPLAGGPPSSAEEGEESAWGVGAAGRAGGEGECFCAVARGRR